MNSIFVDIYTRFTKNKKYLVIYLLAVIVFAAFFGSRLKLHEDISAIIPADERIDQINLVLNQSKFADQIILHFYAKDSNAVMPDSLLAYATLVANKLEADTAHIQKIMLNVSGSVYGELYDFFYNNLPFYLSDADYVELQQRVTEQGIETALLKDFKSLISPAGMATRPYILKDPLSIVPLALKRLENFQIDDNFEIYNSSIFTKDKKHLLVFIDPVYPSGNTAENTTLIQNIEQAISENIPGATLVKGEYYGGTAVGVANASVIKSDIIITVSIAALVLLVFFFLLFRQIKVFALMFVPVVLGAAVSLALLAIFKGSISAIALGVGAVLLGISIDYSLHFFAHLRHSHSIKEQLRELPEPIIMSSLTTASAFLCLSIVKSEALNELGWFAAISVLASAFFVLTVLPAIIPKRMYEASPKVKATFFDKVTNYSFEKNRWLFYILLVLSVIFWFTSKNIGFNGDISTLNYLPDNLKTAESNLKAISSETMSAVYLITSGETLNEALIKTEQLDSVFEMSQKEGLFANKSSATDLILSTEKQQERILVWNKFWNQIDKVKVKENLITKGQETHFKPDAFNQFYKLLNKEFKPVDESEFSLLSQNFLRNYIHHKDSNYAVISILRVEPSNKDAFFDYFKNNKDVVTFDRQYFTNSFFNVLREEFSKLVTVSLIIVFLVLLIFFGRIELAAITFIPILLSWVWTLGLMGIFHIQFNIFNVIISTFIFGLGIDYCIFTMRGLLNNFKYGNRGLQPFRLSILLSAITTILGIGVLIFARHPALKSIALVSVFGIVSVVLIAYILLPRLFGFFIKTKKVQRDSPVTLIDLGISIIVLGFFLSGAGLLMGIIPVLLILPISLKSKKYLYHGLICNTMRFIVFQMPIVRKRIIDKYKLDFSKPSVIICNHQSNLDLGLMLMLHPKIIALTNKWVWNSPVFSFIVRFADYYPAHKGLDYQFDNLRKRVAEGYSILVFPEGTRSVDGYMSRFHQGAFYLADAMNIDIQPLMIHGLNHCLSKTEFFMRQGIMTLKVYDRIPVKKLDGTFHAQAKEVTAMYRREFEQLSNELETPDYFKRKVINKYLYKGPVLEWYLKVKLRLEKNYNFFNDSIPRQAVISDIGCGYGFMALMLKMVSKNRTIYGMDYDAEKISVASHIAENYEGLSFSSGDALLLDFNKSDVFILADMLHYLPLNKQTQLVEKCMQHLNPGGKIIIRDADADLEKRTKVTQITEFFSTRFFRFNKADIEHLEYTSGSRIAEIASRNGFTIKKFDNAKSTSNITFILEASDTKNE